MTEVYRRKPRIHPIGRGPVDHHARDRPVNGLLQTPYCPRDVIGTEFYIPGTEPVHD